MEKTENNEIIVIPSFDKYNPAISGTKAQNQISEGEIISHSRYVWPFTSKIDVTLSWNENYGDLELYVYRSDDTLIGHYTDLYDSSSKDGLIDIDIKTSSGFLPMGDWKLNVYGREVSGASLDYSLT
ncbi:hypothetical protein [Methanoplanus limicola]|nr:hypothetical protein [Methanoplanus limicola]